MDSYKIKWDARAIKDLKKVHKPYVKNILLTVSSLANEPLQGKKLKGAFKNYYRLRIGNYRVVYSIKKSIVEIHILRIGKRDAIYH